MMYSDLKLSNTYSVYNLTFSTSPKRAFMWSIRDCYSSKCELKKEFLYGSNIWIIHTNFVFIRDFEHKFEIRKLGWNIFLDIYLIINLIYLHK